MGFFGIGGLSLKNADMESVQRYCDRRKKMGKFHLHWATVLDIVETLQSAPDSAGDEESITITRHPDDPGVTVRRSRIGDLKAVLNHVGHWAGQTEQELHQGHDHSQGYVLYWGNKFVFVIRRLSARKFACYDTLGNLS